MGNRTFLYTTDALPVPGGAAPALCDAVAEGNNFLPPLWAVLFSAAQPGPAQDHQQVFLASICGGIYAPRTLAESRMFSLLECLAGHPMLDDRSLFERKTGALRAFCATLDGLAYSADLNEWFHLSPQSPGSDPIDEFIEQCALRWEQAERAIAQADYGTLESLFNFSPGNAADMLGFRCWSHAYFHDAAPALDFDAFCQQQTPADDDDDDDEWWVGHGMLGFAYDGKCGLRADEESGGAVILAPVYDSMDAFEPGIEVASLELNGLWGLYDVHGRVVLAPQLDELFEYEEDMAVASKGGKFGYLDKRGAWLVAPCYEDCDAFVNGMALVRRNGLAGYIDQNGIEVIAPQFLDGCGFNAAGFASVHTAQGFAVINRSGAMVSAAHYPSMTWHEELAAWLGKRSDGAHDVLFADGAAWFSSTFDDIDCLVDGGDALMRAGRAYGSVQRNGKPGIPFKYSNIALIQASGPLLYEVASAEKKKLCGACLADGQLVVPLLYTSVDPLAFIPYQEHSEHAAQHLQLQAGGRLGAWSLTLERQVLDCLYDGLWALRVEGKVFFLAHQKRRGWTVADASGKLLGGRTFDWLMDTTVTGSEQYHAYLLGTDFVSNWSGNQAVRGGCDGVELRLYSDGRTLDEVGYQLQRAYDPQEAPIVSLDSLVQGLPLPAKAERIVSHVMAGVANPDACHALGDIYAAGWGVDVDRFKSCRWYATAAAGGHREAQYWYGFHLMDGLGCDADPFAARAQFEALGPQHKQALNCLGYLYDYSLGKQCDQARARALYMAAAEGERHGYAVAQLNAGHCWRHGRGGPVDLHQALRYYAWAEADEDAMRCAAEVCCELAQAARRPAEREPFVEKAIYYYQKMLAQGQYGALIQLARCYLGQFGGTRQVAPAKKYLLEAQAIDEFAGEAAFLLRGLD